LAERFGFVCAAHKMTVEDVSTVTDPCILFWNLSHFVVLEKFEKGKFFVHDPNHCSMHYNSEEFSKCFTGICLILKPSKKTIINKSKKKRWHLGNILFEDKPIRHLAIMLLLISLAAQVCFFMFPIISWKISTLSGPSSFKANDISFLSSVTVICFSSFVVMSLRGYVAAQLGSALKKVCYRSLLRCLSVLPISWFEVREIGDIIGRMQSIVVFERLFAEPAVGIIIDISIFTISICGLIIFGGYISLVTILFTALSMFIKYQFMLIIQPIERIAVAARAKEMNGLVSLLRGIRVLKLNNSVQSRIDRCYKHYLSSVEIEVKSKSISNLSDSFEAALENLDLIFSMILIFGGNTHHIGVASSAIGFLVFRAQFRSAARNLSQKSADILTSRPYIERVEHIFASADKSEKSFVGNAKHDIQGNLELKSVKFSYEEGSKEVLKEISINIRQGEHVAIIGPSGSGKSTILKLVSGIISPNSGSILFDGVDQKYLDQSYLNGQMSFILQDDQLFPGSIIDNITMFSNIADLDLAIESARLASVHEKIIAFPMGYETLIGDMGSAISGGEAQRIIIARALYRRPKLIFIDEGTSSLDTENEILVSEAISSLRITRITIAHRANTINSADRIIAIGSEEKKY